MEYIFYYVCVWVLYTLWLLNDVNTNSEYYSDNPTELTEDRWLCVVAGLFWPIVVCVEIYVRLREWLDR